MCFGRTSSMLTKKLRFLLLALTCWAAPFSFSQTRDLGAIQGQVQDSRGAALPGAQLSLRSNASGLSRENRTDSNGHYAFTGLPLTGDYVLTVNAPKFTPAERKGIELRAGSAATINFQLRVAGESTTVEVYGTTDSLETNTSQISDRLDLAKIETTPVLNNRMTSLQLLDSSVRLAQTTGDLFL